ncbi:TonB family protein [Parasphingorhabdus sp.]|uniref:energy transducer TonB n=1 Tax=Parasphingorhabdus sp. TaxID=2709688 RepID=UPI003A8F55A6
MSYVSVYENKTPRSKGVILAGVVHAAIVAGVIAMPGIEIPDKFPGTVIAIPMLAQQPPEPVIEETPEIKIAVQTRQKVPDKPVIDLPPAPPVPVDNYSHLNLGAGSLGEGTAIPFETIEVGPAPVIVEPRLNQRFARDFQPDYPAGQLRLEQEAVVSVRVLVGTDGRVKRITLIDSPHRDFWEATRKQALNKWRFMPGSEDGKPVETWMTLKVRFEIKG